MMKIGVGAQNDKENKVDRNTCNMIKEILIINYKNCLKNKIIIMLTSTV